MKSMFRTYVFFITVFISANSFSGSAVDLVASCITGGQGTQADPWLGWEDKSSCFSPGKTVHLTAGYYSVTKMTILDSDLK